MGSTVRKRATECMSRCAIDGQMHVYATVYRLEKNRNVMWIYNQSAVRDRRT